MKMPPFPELPLRAVEGWSADDLYDFARQYGEAVREACAKLCDRLSVSEYPTDCDDCAAAIRKDTP